MKSVDSEFAPGEESKMSLRTKQKGLKEQKNFQGDYFDEDISTLD